MNRLVRCLLVAVLLAFAWKDSIQKIAWPPPGVDTAVAPRPPAELLEEASEVAKLVPNILPSDRRHLAAFYDALMFVLARDGERAEPVISSTAKFAALHAGSLNLAIEKKKVGRYPGLDKAIDKALMRIAGDDEGPVDEKRRGKLLAACGTLSWIFSIHHE